MPFTLPSGDDSTPLLRSDPTRPDRWTALLARIATPNAYGFLPYVTVLEDPALIGLTEEQIRDLPRVTSAERFVLIADELTLSDDDFPILVVDLSGENRPSFRVTAACLWSVQNNLSLANMDWEEFSESTDAAGVYRDC
jgi:hypothetical protein